MNVGKAIVLGGLAMLPAVVFCADVSDEEMRAAQHRMVYRNDVQKELELTDDQVHALRPDIGAFLKGLRDREVKRVSANTLHEKAAIQEESRKSLVEAKEGFYRTRQDVLLPHQLARLDEIAWQARGLEDLPKALGDALQLNPDQRLAIAKKETELLVQLHDKTSTLFEKSKRELESLLTPEQQRQWQATVGPEFTFDAKPKRILHRLK